MGGRRSRPGYLGAYKQRQQSKLADDDDYWRNLTRTGYKVGDPHKS